MENQSEGSLDPSFSIWRRLTESVVFKAGALGLIALVLWIPLGEIQGLLDEREKRKSEAVAEIAKQWGGEQALVGPVLEVPILGE
ncbi:MAG: inner membrane CreD family protein, partial [Verrucomicrobiota bacterium]